MSDRRDFSKLDDLQSGQVILLEWGMSVQWPHCPRYFSSHHGPYVPGTVDQLVQIGVTIERKPDITAIRNQMADHIAAIFHYHRIAVDENIMHRFINHQVPEMKEESAMVPIDLYIVTNVEYLKKQQKVTLKTYKPSVERPEYEVYILQSGYHPTHIERVKIVRNPDDALNATS